MKEGDRAAYIREGFIVKLQEISCSFCPLSLEFGKTARLKAILQIIWSWGWKNGSSAVFLQKAHLFCRVTCQLQFPCPLIPKLAIIIQSPKKWLVRGLVKFIPAVARLVCPNLLRSFLTMFRKPFFRALYTAKSAICWWIEHDGLLTQQLLNLPHPSLFHPWV